MKMLERIPENPILSPNQNNSWESEATFNPSIVSDGEKYHLLYRAIGKEEHRDEFDMSLSSIGYAESSDGINFTNRKQLIIPKYDWEFFGCEDPRITKIDNKYFIFYTALSGYPFSADNIKIGVAVTEDFIIVKKHQVTPFNAKAMALFPEKIDGKYVAILTAHSDLPPSKIALAFFEQESDIWSPRYWRDWYADINSNVLPLLRSLNDHVEVGTQPIKTEKGWLIIYSYIENYFANEREFGIEALLLDLKNPHKIIGRTKNLLIPEEKYEKEGVVKNIVFPSGAIVNGDELWVYYGAADTRGCVAKIKLADVFDELISEKKSDFIESETLKVGFKRYYDNPIIEPRFEFEWEQKGTLNPAACQDKNGVHIFYRAFSNDDTSRLGYAFSKNGLQIDERLSFPAYIPREEFELKKDGGFSGCEDPRITFIDDKYFMLYTAYNGDIPRVAMTSISPQDLSNKNWNWEKPRIISAPNVKDKNSCIFPRTIDGDYVILHRTERSIFIDFVDKETFYNGHEFLTTEYLLLRPRADMWDNIKIGSAAPPIETKEGWLLFYHGYSDPGAIYKVGAVLLDLNDPRDVITRTDIPLLEPEKEYEKQGFVHNVVFPCGTALIDGNIHLYYGGADFVICVAVINLNELLDHLCKKKK